MWAYHAETINAVTERQWQGAVVALFRAKGWRVYHTHNSIHSDHGYPDLTCVHQAQQRVVWIELKRMKGVLKPHQREWLDLLELAGQEAYCLRPDEWQLAVDISNDRPLS